MLKRAVMGHRLARPHGASLSGPTTVAAPQSAHGPIIRPRHGQLLGDGTTASGVATNEAPDQPMPIVQRMRRAVWNKVVEPGVKLGSHALRSSASSSSYTPSWRAFSSASSASSAASSAFLSTYNPKRDRASSKSLFRADNFPFRGTQPGYGTPKSHLNAQGELLPVDEKGSTTAAQHVHGKPEDKAKSPYTSTSSNLDKVNAYGHHLIETLPKEEQVLTQKDIQADLRTSPDPRLKETAHNVTQRGQPLWTPPTKEHEDSAKEVGIDPKKPEFTYGERAQINSSRDEEQLVKGKVTDNRLWKFVDANKLHGKGKFGTGKGQIDLEKLGLSQGRDPRSLHPEGFRVPTDAYGVEYLHHQDKHRQQQEEIQKEREEDEAARKEKTAS